MTAPKIHRAISPAGALAMLLLAGGCRGERTQSALHPEGPAAAAIAELWWAMFAAGTAVFVLVLVLLWLAIRRPAGAGPAAPLAPAGPGEAAPLAPASPLAPAGPEAPLGERRFIVLLGLVMPTIVLVPLLVYSLYTSLLLRTPEAAVTIEVIGHQFWWEVRYPDYGIVTANQIHIPAGEPVRLELRAADVIHSFWVPQLHGKMDLLPERTNVFWIEARQPGVFRGQCAEFCGVQHAHMAFLVVAEEPEAFDAWLARNRRPAVEPETELHARGLEVFIEAGCGNCHAIRETVAEPGEVGPDLTHFGSRLTIGAGIRPHTLGDLAGWIANPQAIKPGNRMPPTFLPADDLDALVAYLRSLE